jgi:hypothetical protein
MVMANARKIVTGNITFGTQSEQLPSVEIPGGFYVILKPRRTNVGAIFLGDSMASANSVNGNYQLEPLDPPLFLKISNLDLLFCRGTANDVLSWIVEKY